MGALRTTLSHISHAITGAIGRQEMSTCVLVMANSSPLCELDLDRLQRLSEKSRDAMRFKVIEAFDKVQLLASHLSTIRQLILQRTSIHIRPRVQKYLLPWWDGGFYAEFDRRACTAITNAASHKLPTRCRCVALRMHPYAISGTSCTVSN